MTNLQSLAGGAVWVAVAAILMLITFEPVSVDQALQSTAQAPAASDTAAA